MSGLSVLSFGFTRGLWDGDTAEDLLRMRGYAEHLAEYFVVTNSYKRHRLAARRFAANFSAFPTDAFTPLDSFLRMLWMGRRILRTHPVSVIQAQDPFFCGLVATLLGKLFRRPVVICVYGPNVYDAHWLASHWWHRVLAPIGRWVLRESQCIQVDGSMTARRLIAAGCRGERIEVKPMVPANLREFLEIPRPAAPRKITRLLFVGRFCAQKNLSLLLVVVKALRERTKASFELVLVGEGPLEPELRTVVKREGLDDCVFFRGPVSREEIVREFAGADIFVLTSDYEGYPRVLMEAAAAALPIVTTAVSGSDEAVADGESGYIVPIRSADALVKKLISLFERPELRLTMGLAGRERIARLDPATNTPRQVAIWQKVVRDWDPLERACAEPRHLLVFNLATDASDPILGFTTRWIRELAAQVESVDVITMRAGAIDVPANVRVHSVGKELGYSEPRRVVAFYSHLLRILCTRRVDGCFSHMIPEFSALAGPVLRASGIPLVTWYAHPSLTWWLKLAHLFSNRMVTSLPGAYPYRKEKLAVVGQGIDTQLFAPGPVRRRTGGCEASDDLILCVGRISRVKDHPTLLRAIALLPRRVRVVILGATAGADDEAYADELRELAVQLGMDDAVTFAPPVSMTDLPEHYRRCAVHVNLTPPGFGDKVAWEAMSCGRPCLVANEDFRETLGEHAATLLFRPGDADDLSQKLAALLDKSASERAAIGATLRAQVERLHSLPRLAKRILIELGNVAERQPADVKPSLATSEAACIS